MTACVFVSSIIDAEECKLLKFIDCQHLHHDFLIAFCSRIPASKIVLKAEEYKFKVVLEANVINLLLLKSSTVGEET